VGNLNVALFFIVAAGMLKPAQPILARREGAAPPRAVRRLGHTLRSRYMTLETMSAVSGTSAVSLPAVAA
jgi:hypothetical protein